MVRKEGGQRTMNIRSRGVFGGGGGEEYVKTWYATKTAVIARPTTANRKIVRHSLLIQLNFSLRYYLSESLCPLRLCVQLFSSLPRRRCLRYLAALRLRHPLIIRCRLFQQFLALFHLRAHCLRALKIRLARRPFFRRREPLIAPQRFPRQRLTLLQARQLIQIAQPK